MTNNHRRRPYRTTPTAAVKVIIHLAERGRPARLGSSDRTGQLVETVRAASEHVFCPTRILHGTRVLGKLRTYRREPTPTCTSVTPLFTRHRLRVRLARPTIRHLVIDTNARIFSCVSAVLTIFVLRRRHVIIQSVCGFSVFRLVFS